MRALRALCGCSPCDFIRQVSRLKRQLPFLNSSAAITHIKRCPIASPRDAEQTPDPLRAHQPWVAVDETAVTIGTKQQGLYATIEIETKLLLGVHISNRRGTDPAAAFLGRLAENHDLSDTTFLVDGMGYLIALARCDLRDHLNHVDRNLIEKWLQTLAMRIDRFHQTWMGG